MKNNIKRMRKQPIDWENIFANNTSDKELLSKIYKELLKLNNKKMKKLSKKWSKELNRHLTKEDIQVASNHMKRCSTSYVIREIQINTTLRYHYTCIRMTQIQNTDKCWWGCGATGTLTHCLWDCEMWQSLWKTI